MAVSCDLTDSGNDDNSATTLPTRTRDIGKARLYEDGIFPTADGRARFAAHAWQPTAEQRESRYPFSLTTGRLRDQWHGMTRTGTLGRLFGHVAEPSVQLHPQDMERRQLKNGDLVHVTSKRGSIVVPVQADATLGLSQAFMAMHWGSEFLSGVLVHRRAAGGRECAHHFGVLPHLQTARAQARRREGAQGRAALDPAGHGLVARTPTRKRVSAAR
jgi:anaerobic selenocysteine-containing dehydrogenase